MSGLLTLAGIGTAMAAIVLCVKSITWESDDVLSFVCDRPAPATTTPDYRWRWRSYENSDWWEDECKISMQLLKVRTGVPSDRDPSQPFVPKELGTGSRDVGSLSLDLILGLWFRF